MLQDPIDYHSLIPFHILALISKAITQLGVKDTVGISPSVHIPTQTIVRLWLDSGQTLLDLNPKESLYEG